MTTEQQVKELAYKLWEDEGYPIGNEQEHYFRAMQILESAVAENSSVEVEQPEKPRATRKRTTKASAETSAKKPTTRKRASKPKES